MENVYLITKTKLLCSFKADMLWIINILAATLGFIQDGTLGDPCNHSHSLACLWKCILYIAYLATKIKLLNGFKAEILEIIEILVAILFFNQDGGLGDP